MERDAQAAELAAYEAVVGYVDRDLVRLTPRRKDPRGKVEAALRFNRALGDPQARYPAIQVAGTSGKGSTCWLLAEALRAAGLHVGLHVSPYLQSFCEKTWIDGRYARPSALAAALARVRPESERARRDEELPASVHGLTSLALSYEAFAAAGVELAVIETGCGGRFDLVQGLDKALCVITDLALDHEQALGGTLEQIAWHKAGILEGGVPAVMLAGPGGEVVAHEAAALGVPLRQVEQRELLAGPGRLRLPSLGEVCLPAGERAGGFRLRNACLAALALDSLATAGWSVRAEHLEAALRAPAAPGRLEEVEPGVFLDGAHNPHKLEGCLQALCGPAGGPGAPRLKVLLGASGFRAPADLVEVLAPWGPSLLTTRLELYGKQTVAAEELAACARGLGLAAEACLPPLEALERALAERRPDELLLITGSIYLIGLLRERWYPQAEVILQGSSRPVL